MISKLAIPETTTHLPGYTLPPVPRQGTRVILLRHGRSTLNDAGCYQGSSDESDLTDKGRLASRQVGEFLRHCPIDHLYTSPLRRARQTVQELLPQLEAIAPLPITLSGMLREIDLPAWEGLPYEEVKARFPDAYRCWQTTPEQFAMTGSKQKSNNGKGKPQDASEPLMYPVQDVYRRARDFWVTILPKHRGQTVLVVSHGGTIQALVNRALGLSMQQHHKIQQTHSGLTVIDFDAPVLGAGHLHLLNLTTPLGERLPKLKAGKQGLRLLLLPCQTEISPDVPLGKLVQGHPITACVVQDHPCCHPNQRVLLAHHPETVTLSVGRANFLHHWQQSALQSLGQASSAELTTVAAVCHQAHAESFLRQLMGHSLPLLPNALTVVHYPGVGVRPIVQTLNSRPVSIRHS